LATIKFIKKHSFIYENKKSEILSRVERAGDPYRNYLWDLSVGILAIVFGMRYLIYATLWSLKQIRK